MTHLAVLVTSTCRSKQSQVAHAHTPKYRERDCFSLSSIVGPAGRKCVFYITAGSLTLLPPSLVHLLPLTIETDQDREPHHLITRRHRLITGLCLTISNRL